MNLVLTVFVVLFGILFLRFFKKKQEMKNMAQYFLTPPRHWFFGYVLTSETYDPVGM